MEKLQQINLFFVEYIINNINYMRNLFYSMLVVVATATFLSCSKNEENEPVINYLDGDEIRLKGTFLNITLPPGTYVADGKNITTDDYGFLDYSVELSPDLIQGAKNSITFIAAKGNGTIDVTKCQALDSLDLYGSNFPLINASNCKGLTAVSIKSQDSDFWADTINLSGCLNISNISFGTGLNFQILNLSRSGIVDFVYGAGTQDLYGRIFNFTDCKKMKTFYSECPRMDDSTEMLFKGCSDLILFNGSTWYNRFYGRHSYKLLDFTGCEALDTIKCGSFLPNHLILDGCTSLRYLDCSGYYGYYSRDVDPPMDTLDLSACPALTYLNCEGVGLTSLDISANQNLRYLRCFGNNFSEEEMNKIYEDLPVVEEGWVIANRRYENSNTPVGNYQIAEKKGWTVEAFSYSGWWD